MRDVERGQPTLLVGIGASAGGLDAFEQLLPTLPTDAGMAFLLVQHLAPDHGSALAELLQRTTSMLVAEATDGAAVQPNTITVIQPGSSMGVRDGHVTLESAAGPGPRMPIDHLFRSLARSGSPCAAVVLSGAGSDGTAGLREVRHAGGLTIAQEPETASQPGMPRRAASSGEIDLVLPIDGIAAALERFARGLSPAPERGATHEGPSSDQLAAIADLLNERNQVDVSIYKEGTLGRRLTRRMALTGLTDFDAYLEHLQADATERTALLQDLLISVSDFFRDPPAWEELTARVIEPLVARARPGDELRAWVAGCATGEEAYTLAMLMLEAADQADKGLHVRVFATDVDIEGIATGREGWYGPEIAERVSEARMQRFFAPAGAGFRVLPHLRHVLSFASHDLTTDSPFSKMDLVTCRNVLIYLRSSAQRRVLRSLHFALKPGGALMLGASESVGPERSLFVTVSKQHRIYQRVGQAATLPAPRGRTPRRTDARPRPPEESASDLARQAVLRTAAPPSVVVDAHDQLVYVHGDLLPYLRYPEGAPNRTLTSVLRPDLVSRVRGVLVRSRRDQGAASATSSTEDGVPACRITATPAPEVGDDMVVLTFQVLPEAAPPGPPASEEQASLVAHLQRELDATRSDLRTTVEELESSNEELRTTNEESMSVNEELQSANEELEATSEELRSLNEELNTVNQQLREKMEAVQRAHDDLANFFASSRVATLFLDEDLRLVRFTPEAATLLRLTAAEQGREVTDLAGGVLLHGLGDDASAVLHDLTPRTTEVRTAAGRSFLRQTLPYRTSDRRIGGVVVGFFEVTELREAASRLELRERHASMIASLGVDALRETDLPRFLEGAVRQLHQVLGSDRCVLLELLPDGSWFEPRVSVGAEVPPVPERVPAGPETLEGFSLTAGSVTVRDIASERRFRLGVPAEQGSALCCAIEEGRTRVGVIVLLSERIDAFGEDAERSLRSVANVLATAVLRTRSRRRVAVERGVAQVLTTATTLEEAAPRILGCLVEELEVSLAELWTIEDDRAVCREVAVRAGSSLQREAAASFASRTFRRGEGLVGTAWMRGHGLWLDPLTDDPRYVRRAATAALGLVWGLAFPLTQQDTVLGVVTLFARHRLLHDHTLLESLEAIGRAIGEFSRRVRSEAAVAAAEQRLRLSAEVAHLGTFEWDIQRDVNVWTPELEALYGLEPGSFGGTLEDWLARVHPDDVAAAKQRIEEALETDIFRAEWRAVWPDGSVHWIEGRGTVFRDEQGRPQRMLGVNFDVTERKLSERRVGESEARLRRLFDQAPALIAVHEGPEHVFTYVNPPQVRAVGDRQLIGLPLREAMPELAGQHIIERYDRVLSTGEPVVSPSFPAVIDTKRRHYTQVLQPWFDPDGAVAGVMSFAFDITTEVELRERAEESETRFRALADNMAQLAWMADASGWVGWYNKRWLEYTGTTPEQMDGWGWQAVHHPDHVDAVVRKWRAALEAGEVWEDVFPLRRADGQYRWFLSRAAPIRDEHGRITRWFGTNTDITEQREAEQALRVASQQKDQFLAMLGHELRNPLAGIRTATQLITRLLPDPPPLVSRACGVLERQSMQMTRLVDGLLDVSRLTRGKIELDRQELDLGELVRQVVDDMAAEADLTVSIPDRPVRVHGDPVRLAQVLDNLVGNAVKFSKPPARVRVGLTASAGEAVVTVEDEGVGIDPALLPLVFEPFQQGPQGPARAGGGLGLGLPLARGLVQLHGGTLDLQSDGQGRGTRAVVRLPVLEQAATRRAPVEPARAEQRRILLVEDNADAAETLRTLLELEGHLVETAPDGRSGLALAREDRFDVVLCDLGLPDMSGLDIARELRGSLPIVAISGYAQPEDRARSAEAGFVAHLAKPVELEQVLEVLRQLQTPSPA